MGEGTNKGDEQIEKVRRHQLTSKTNGNGGRLRAGRQKAQTERDRERQGMREWEREGTTEVMLE